MHILQGVGGRTFWATFDGGVEGGGTILSVGVMTSPVIIPLHFIIPSLKNAAISLVYSKKKSKWLSIFIYRLSQENMAIICIILDGFESLVKLMYFPSANLMVALNFLVYIYSLTAIGKETLAHNISICIRFFRKHPLTKMRRKLHKNTIIV